MPRDLHAPPIIGHAALQPTLERPGKGTPAQEARHPRSGQQLLTRNPPDSSFEHRLDRYARVAGSIPGSIRLLTQSKRTFEPWMQLMSQGEPSGAAFIIEHGWTFSSCSQTNGTRQILDVQIPGDIAGLQSLAMPFAMHDVTAITRVQAWEVSSALVSEAVSGDPGLAAFLLWLSAGENAVAAERLTDLGRRTALERTAHFILELATRLRLAGHGSETGFPCPMTQYLLGDALGLTPVHINRMLRELQTAGLVHHQRGWIRLLDKEKLVELASFDDAYLDCTGPFA